MGEKKKEALASFNRNNIIDAAKELFQKKGIALTTMEDIAKKADYSKSTIYVYFKSKDEIYNSIVCEYMMLLRDTLDSTIKKMDGFEECYYAICNNILEFQEKYPLYYESLMGEIEVSKIKLTKGSILSDIYAVGEEINLIIGDLIQRGKEEKYLREDMEVLPTVFYMWSGISGIVSIAGRKKRYFETRLDMSKRDYLQFCFKTFLKSIIE